MAIVRSGSRVSKASTHSSSSTDDDARVKQRQRSAGKALSTSESDTSGNSELDERDAEICQVGEEICAVPFELFELPDLRQILSLDTWNFCLTEEERERLCSLLPDLDQESYKQTLKELFAGEVFHLSSPLTEIFERLKGGLCHPHVVEYTEGLKFLQRKKHCHLLRKYHNGMVNYFLEMQNIWQNYPDAGIEERLEIWNSWKFQKSKHPPPGRPSEKKLGFFKRKRPLGQSLRRDELLEAEDILESQQLLPDKGAVSKADCKRTPKVKAVVKVKVEVAGSSKRTCGKGAEKTKKLAPSGALKRVRKVSLKSHADDDEVATADTVPPLEENTVALPVVVSELETEVTAVENEVMAAEKPALKQRTEKKGKGTTGARKRKRVKECSDTEPHKVEQKSEIYPECSPLKEAACTEDRKVQKEIPVDGERQEEQVTVEDIKNDTEPKKKYRRRAKVKDKVTDKDVQASVVVETEQDGSIADEEINDAVGEDKAPVLNEEQLNGKPPKKRGKKRVKGEGKESMPTAADPDEGPVSEKVALVKKSKKPAPVTVPPIASTFPFSIIHLLSAVRTAMMVPSEDQPPDPSILGGERGVTDNSSREGNCMVPPEVLYSEQNGQPILCDEVLDAKETGDEKRTGLPPVPFLEIVRRVQSNPGDAQILQTQEPLQGLVRGVLKVLSSKTAPPGVKGWKPFVGYVKEARAWSWVGPVSQLLLSDGANEVQISAEAWSVPLKTLVKIQELFANWLKHAQETLQQLGQLGLPPPPPMPIPVDEKERFRELRAQKSLMTIHPSSEEMKAYFQREEVVRYSLPDRAFSYTTADGRKSVVAPLKRIGGKPNSKARDHFMLKSDRPPHVTILCLVRDAASRLPGSIGTRADVCALIRDSQYIVEDVSDAQLNQVVSGALDRLHYERDPCVRYDGDKKLWVYLHTDRDEEDFEDDGTSSTKRWKRQKKESSENLDVVLAQDYSYSSRDDQDPGVLGLDFGSPNCFGGPADLSAVYSTGRPDLVYGHQNGSLTSPHVLGNGFHGQVREDGIFPFIELPPSIQPPCVNMQQSHPMGWEVLGNRWDQEPHFHPHDHLMQEDYDAVAAAAAVHREAGAIIDRGLH